MALPYNPNTPQPNDIIAQTQNPIQQNFASIGTAFNNNPNNFSQYAFQNVTAPAAPVNPIGILHTVLGANFLVNQAIPYWKLPSGDYPLLPDLKTVGTDNGFKFGNIIVNFGILTLNASSIPVTLAIPFSNTNYAVSVTPTSNSALPVSGIISYTPTTTILTVRKGTSMNSAACSYIAIGI
jgi:hypothetical protein